MAAPSKGAALPTPAQTPNTQTPSTLTPSTLTPSTQTPNTQTPSTLTPSTLTPSTQTPSTQTPSTLTPSGPTSLGPPRRAISTRSAARLSPFATLERAFVTLSSHPRPLSLDGTPIVGLPDEPIPLDQLRARLLHPATRYSTRDDAVQALTARARTERGQWTVGLAGVLLPGLRRAVAPLAAACPGKRVDLEAEMLAGLITAIDRCQPDRPRPAGFLCGQAFDAAKRLLRAELAERARPGHDPVSSEPPKPYGHPDLVLADAVKARAIAGEDAELIAATRLGHISLADAACQRGLTYKAAERRRLRAERALVEWIRTGRATTGFVATGFVAIGGVSAGSSSAGRPRQGHRPDQRPGRATPPKPPTTRRR
jgi:hypothetical protein